MANTVVESLRDDVLELVEQVKLIDRKFEGLYAVLEGHAEGLRRVAVLLDEAPAKPVIDVIDHKLDELDVGIHAVADQLEDQFSIQEGKLELIEGQFKAQIALLDDVTDGEHTKLDQILERESNEATAKPPLIDVAALAQAAANILSAEPVLSKERPKFEAIWAILWPAACHAHGISYLIDDGSARDPGTIDDPDFEVKP